MRLELFFCRNYAQHFTLNVISVPLVGENTIIIFPKKLPRFPALKTPIIFLFIVRFSFCKNEVCLLDARLFTEIIKIII